MGRGIERSSVGSGTVKEESVGLKAYSPDVCAKIAQACDEGTAPRGQLGQQLARKWLQMAPAA